MTMPDVQRERSAVVMLVLVFVVVVATSVLMLARFGDHVVSLERASATADVVALAGVTGGDRASVEVARANRANLESLDRSGPLVVVRIERAGDTAIAAAQPAPR
jgi:hypothetical protein